MSALGTLSDDPLASGLQAEDRGVANNRDRAPCLFRPSASSRSHTQVRVPLAFIARPQTEVEKGFQER
jgi:hypothetical protein